MRIILAIIAVAVAAGIVAVFAISDSQQIRNDSDRPNVISSFYPLHEFARNVGGDRVDALLLVPSGVEPHDWEPTIKEVQRLQASDMIVINGAGFETWVDGLVESGYDGILVDTSKGVEIIDADPGTGDHDDDHADETDDHADETDDHADETDDHADETDDHADETDDHADETDDHADETDDHADETDDHADETDDHADETDDHADETDDHADETDDHADETGSGDHDDATTDDDGHANEDDHAGDGDDGHGHGTSGLDPHIWLSPPNAMIQVQNIADAMSEMDPPNESYYQGNAREYKAELAELDSAIREGLSGCSRDFIAFHMAFSYFADEYDLVQHSIIQSTDPHDEVTAGSLEDVILLARDLNIDVVFADDISDPGAAEVVAGELGGSVLSLSPLETTTGKTYIEAMYDNLDGLRKALC